MTGIPFSWLYGATPPQQCPTCGNPVRPGLQNSYEHTRYWCDGAAKSKALTTVSAMFEQAYGRQP